MTATPDICKLPSAQYQAGQPIYPARAAMDCSLRFICMVGAHAHGVGSISVERRHRIGPQILRLDPQSGGAVLHPRLALHHVHQRVAAASHLPRSAALQMHAHQRLMVGVIAGPGRRSPQLRSRVRRGPAQAANGSAVPAALAAAGHWPAGPAARRQHCGPAPGTDRPDSPPHRRSSGARLRACSSACSSACRAIR